MKANDALIAADILNALDGLPDVRKGLKHKSKYSDPVVLEVGAFEGDDNGGAGHGSVFIPLSLASKILDAAEKVLLDELTRLGVSR